MAEDVMYISNYLRLYLKVKAYGSYIYSKKTGNSWGFNYKHTRYACLHDVLCYLKGAISNTELNLLMYNIP